MNILKTTKLAAATVALLGVVPITQADVVEQWHYDLDVQFSSWDFNPGAGLQANVNSAKNTIMWGSVEYGGQGLTNHTASNNSPASSRSGLMLTKNNVIDSTAPGWVKTGVTKETNTLTHSNSAILSTFRDLKSATFTVNLSVTPSGGNETFSLSGGSEKFTINFSETLNASGKNDVDGDIFVTDFKPFTGSFIYDGYSYDYIYGVINNSISTLSPSVCSKFKFAGVGAECSGFVTPEHSNTEVKFGLWIGNPTAVPEPETYAMLLAGLGIVGVVARRRRATIQG